MEDNKAGVCVDIFGAEYIIKGDGDKAHIKEIAGYVDTKMRSIAASTSNVSSLKVAILTCLNIADEVSKLKRENNSHLRNDEKVEVLIKTLENQGL
ncbi:MAG: cell division protein ZapA [Candidatus Firestonebacteria bacterium]